MLIKEYVPIKVAEQPAEGNSQKKKRRRQKKKKNLNQCETLTMASTTTDTNSGEINSIEASTEKVYLSDSDRSMSHECEECDTTNLLSNSDTGSNKNFLPPNYSCENDQAAIQQFFEPIYTKAFLTSFLKSYTVHELSEDIKFYAGRRCQEVPVELAVARSSLSQIQFMKRTSFKPLDEKAPENKGQPIFIESESLPLLRKTLTEEEKTYKEKITSSVGKWSDQMKVKSESEQLEMSIRFHLNILTPENFEIVKLELLAIAREGLAAGQTLSDLIIEKAWNEVKYAKVYAQLCDFLSKDNSLFFQQNSKEQKRNDFKVYTLRKIQHSFDCESAVAPKCSKSFSEMDQEEKALFLSRKKKLMIGNVIFIGELFSKNFLTSQVIRICFSILFSRFLTERSQISKETGNRSEDHLEALIALLENVGKIFEERERQNSSEVEGQQGALVQACKSMLENQQTKPKFTALKFPFADVFNALDLISMKTQLSSRLKSLIQNLNHRKKNDWKAPEFTTQQPKTLRQIREEIENEGKQMVIKFRADSGNFSGSQNRKAQPLTPTKMCLEQVIDAFNKIFKNLDVSADEDEAIVALQKTSADTDAKTFIKGFLKTFSDGSKTAVSRRVQLFPKLVSSKLVQENYFAVAFGECLFELWMEASDFPGIEANYATIFAGMINANKIKLSDFYVHPSLATHEDKEIIMDTYSQFFTELKTITRSQDVSLFSDLEKLTVRVISL